MKHLARKTFAPVSFRDKTALADIRLTSVCCGLALVRNGLASNRYGLASVRNRLA